MVKNVGLKENNLSKTKKNSYYDKLEQVIGCKWSIAVLENIQNGTCRPGALEKSIDGISQKVLSERLRKLVAYGLLEKVSFNEIPPRTEYKLTIAGIRLIKIIDQIHALDEEIE